MEKEKLTIVEYYSNLFTLLSNGKNSFVISVEDIYREATELNKSLGLKTNSSILWGTKKTFLKIFNSYIKESVIDTTHKRKGIRSMYSIEIKPSDLVGLDLKLVKAFPLLKRTICKGERTVKTSSPITPVKVVGEVIKESKKSKKLTAIPGKRLPRRDWLFKFFELLKIANASKNNRLSKKTIMSTMSLSNIPSMDKLINAWKSTLMRGGIVAHFSLYKTLSNETELIIVNSSALIKEVGTKYKDWFGVDLGADKVLNISSSIPIDKVIVRPKIEPILPFTVAYTIFAIGGICKKQETVVNYEILYKLLKDNFSIKITRNEIIELVRKEAVGYLEVCNQGAGGIKLKSSANWDDFLEKFSPKNFKEFTYIRLSMSLEEIKNLLPDFEIEVVTEFTANDAVYKIVYDKSIHSLKSLCGLYRKFRGQDKFFDNDLTKIIQDEIVYVDSRSYVGNLAYEFEC